MEQLQQGLSAVLQQQGPAETTDYMIMGYAVLFIVLGIYLASLYVRNRNLTRDADLLLEIEAQESANEDLTQARIST
jgi:hypothetical protein